jgi:hypothetical protein
MASTYVNNLRLEEIATGEKSGTWGGITNTNLELVGEALGYGTENLGSDANTTITVADGAADAARSFYLKITSTSLSADRTVTLAPNTISKVWIIENATTGGKAITIKQGTGATIDIPNGDVKMVATDGAGAGGAVFDLLVDLNIATKLTVKNPSTSDDTPASIVLQTGDTDIAADDKLGVINFQAPDEGTGTDAILVAAGIEAVSEGDFSSSSNATKLSFKTASSEAAAEKMSLSSAGLLTIADDLVIGDGKTIGSASDADAITIASDGKVTLAEIATASKGIAFPSTQVASTDGNTLDDYEEGTWTPTIVGGTSAGSYTLSSSFDDGYYQKIGRMVTVRGIVQLSSIGSAGSGAYLFGGLPFNIDVSHNAGAGTLVMDSVATGRTTANIIGIAVTNPSGSDGDKLRVTMVEDDAGFQTLQISQAASADFFEFTYHYATTA